MAPKTAVPLLDRINVTWSLLERFNVTAAELENPEFRGQARARLGHAMLVRTARHMCVPVEDVSFAPPEFAHAPRSQTMRLAGETFQAWTCRNCKKRFIHMMTHNGETQRPVYIRVPDCETTRLSKERWLLEQQKKQKSTRGQVPTPRDYPWHRSLEQYLELSQAYAAPAPAASTAGSSEATATPAVIREPSELAVPPVELQDAANAGAITAQHFMTTGAPVREQVQAEMQRASAFTTSLAQNSTWNLTAAEAMMQASQQSPIRANKEDVEWHQVRRV